MCISLSDHSVNGLELLKRCRDGYQEIDLLNDSIQFRRDSLERCTQRISGIPHSKGGIYDKISEITAEVDELERQCTARKEAHAAELCAAVWVLDRLCRYERDVIQLLYFDRVSIRIAARTLGYSESSIKRFKAAGEAKCKEVQQDDLRGLLPEWYK